MRRNAMNVMWMASVLAASLFGLPAAAAKAAEPDLPLDAKFDAYLQASTRHDHFSGTVLSRATGCLFSVAPTAWPITSSTCRTRRGPCIASLR